MEWSCLWVHSSGQTVSERSSSSYYCHSKVGDVGGAELCERSLYGAIVKGVEETSEIHLLDFSFQAILTAFN